jgi:tryptophan synthase alpha chain
MSNWFDNLKKNAKALCPFLTSGYPSPGRCEEYLEALARGGADVIELGVPFSDPLADGPVIQSTSLKALRAGATVASTLRTIRRFRAAPCVVMTYLNPLLAYGLKRFFHDAGEAGAAGVIPVDLIPEEADEFLAAAGPMPVTFLASPTCSDARLRLIARRTTGFVYVVSVKGVTGARTSLPPGLEEFVERVRRFCDRPLYVGFGISTPRQAREVAAVADGVVVGSALLRRIEEGASPAAIETFVRSLKRAVGNLHAAAR